ncbi:uncharacterized protein LOC120328176 isoform X1 [Styela clava]
MGVSSFFPSAISMLLISGIVLCSEDDFFKYNKAIYEGPSNITVMQGETARFGCLVHSGIEDIRVQWSIDGVFTGIWPPPPGHTRLGFSYPKDGDKSLDVYDIELTSASWQKHEGLTFECQVIGVARSGVATLTVIVPTSRLDMIPAPKDGVIVSPRRDLISVGCETNYATSEAVISWKIDGNVPHADEVSTRKLNITSKNGKSNLTKVISEISRQIITSENSTNVNLSDYSKKEELTKRNAKETMIQNLEKRRLLESMYESVYHVTCEADSEYLQSGSILRSSAWIVAERKELLQHRSTAKEETVYDYNNILYITLACGLLLAVVILAIGCFVIRRCPNRTTRRPAEEQDVTAGNSKLIYIPDQGIASSVGSQDRFSDGDTLRSGSHVHMLHGQADVTEGVRCNVPTFDTFARGDGLLSTLESEGRDQSKRSIDGSMKSESSSTIKNSTLREEMTNFLSRQYSEPPGGRGASSQNTQSDTRQQMVYTIPRSRGSNFFLDPPSQQPSQLHHKFDRLGTELYKSAYGSLPRQRYSDKRGMQEFSLENVDKECAIMANSTNIDDLPLPPPPPLPEVAPSDTSTEISHFPPPMPVLGDLSCVVLPDDLYPTLTRYEPTYNLVYGSSYNSTADGNQVSVRHNSETSPGSSASGKELSLPTGRYRQVPSSLV